MDTFFTKCKELIEEFTTLTGPLNEAKDTFYEASGFFEVPGAKPKHIIVGVILTFGSLAAGDLNKVI